MAINIDLLRDGQFVKIAETRTDANGRYATNFSYGRGNLRGYRIRTTYKVPNRVFWETAKSHYISRIAVLNAVVTPTTAAEVASTYRDGCPVGRSKLSTITMNYYGLDKRMHRGVLIVRSDLAGEIKYAFSRSLGVRFPITKMVNPNVYGGNDPAQMRADNSSGFNCRAVVGNPYRQVAALVRHRDRRQPAAEPLPGHQREVVAGERHRVHRPDAAPGGHAQPGLDDGQGAATATASSGAACGPRARTTSTSSTDALSVRRAGRPVQCWPGWSA